MRISPLGSGRQARRPRQADRRVARGGCPPRAPTDPYVRDYRIRLLELGTRCETIDRLHHTGGWKRIPLKHRAKPIPSHPCAVRAPVQPFPPNAPDLIPVSLQGAKVSGEAVVGIVALQLAL